MQQALHRSSLVTRGFIVESAYYCGSGFRGRRPVPVVERFRDVSIAAIDAA
ncbi:hypothetical protein ABIF38_002978 [Bradyrhizobium japonicum]|jgi:hypothetical protein|uniref:Uncharacterized protein n=1 Tax=Bradyrhizobium elkanii TaxID=29448 RepID=A0ABV4FCM8_BRAEL|nr:hypothetical protein [Bradyrhizobium elkanii]MCP1734707.1 hypothetical protein [Bradyrhizobium elkanii]MCP1752809.1 hypothetical protein [Bradyrhizobium elkanii]MCP1966324.1 hypothetical protein [Bradyrhizobium elkanii]MCS3522488.1 hypothetical protein [Bradyrhizobium elkanii]